MQQIESKKSQPEPKSADFQLLQHEDGNYD